MDTCVSPCASGQALNALLFLLSLTASGANGEEPIASIPNVQNVVNFFGDTKPAVSADPNDRNPVELGLKFQSSEPGDVIGVRFYRAVVDPKGHTVSIWTSKGRRLATASIKPPKMSTEGWIEVKLPSPLQIAPGETYIASYHTSIGQYAIEEGGMSSGLIRGPLTALPGGTNGGNGVFRYGKTSEMPTYSSQNTHFYVDVMFRPDKRRHIASKMNGKTAGKAADKTN